jgi:ABC-type lipoprotein release transport system permease subunit
MSVILGAAFARVMTPVPVMLAPASNGVLRWLGVAVAVSIASCAWPAMRAMRCRPAKALAYE